MRARHRCEPGGYTVRSVSGGIIHHAGKAHGNMGPADMADRFLSWLMGAGKGDDFISNTVLLTENGPEVLTRTPVGPIIRRASGLFARRQQ